MRARHSNPLASFPLALVLVSFFATSASAQTVRAVLLTKHVLDGQNVSESGLDAAATAALQRTGLRMVDLESALRSQRDVLSDQVQAGRVPNELTVLNADVLVSLQLRCSQSSAAVLDSNLHAQFCVLDTKVVSTTAGDVLYAESQRFTGHGLNAQMAVQSLLDKRLPKVVETTANTWLASLARADSWSVDLTVARISDRETGRALAKQLGRLHGVSGVRLLAYDRSLAKYVLAGHGQMQLEELANAIDDDPKLSLSVTYETARLLHAEFSYVKAYKQRVMAMSIVPRSSELQAVAPEVMRAALMNLPYLEMAHTLPLAASTEDARVLETRLREKAKALHVPLVLSASMAPDAQGWLAALKLMETISGRTLTAASGSAETSTQALDVAVRSFDENFRATLGQAAVRARLGLNDLATELANDPRLVIQAFKLPPVAGVADAGLLGSMSLRNDSPNAISNAELKMRTAEREVFAQRLPEIAARGSLMLPIALDREKLNGASLVTATVTYVSGDSYTRVAAVTPRIPALTESRGDVAAHNDSAAPVGYSEVYSAAVKKHDSGEWRDARALFRRSDALFSNALTLRGLGMVEFDLGEYDAAQRYFEASLGAKALALDAGQRVEVRKLLVRAREAARDGLRGASTASAAKFY
jgi:tetratricopeptide (TPR) repeat protein